MRSINIEEDSVGHQKVEYIFEAGCQCTPYPPCLSFWQKKLKEKTVITVRYNKRENLGGDFCWEGHPESLLMCRYLESISIEIKSAVLESDLNRLEPQRQQSNPATMNNFRLVKYYTPCWGCTWFNSPKIVE